VLAPPPHPADMALNTRTKLPKNTISSCGRFPPASGLRTRSPNNMTPFLFAQVSADSKMIAVPHA